MTFAQMVRHAQTDENSNPSSTTTGSTFVVLFHIVYNFFLRSYI
jgi:hypothetical protein